LLGFVALVYLGLKGGGYDPLVHDQIGIVVWWLLAGTVLVGALPRRRPTTLALVALALILAFLAWTALSLVWTESSERTFADVARIAGYAGFFVIAVLARETGSARRMVAAVGCAIAVIAFVGLLSRLHPAWFPNSANDTYKFLPGVEERLSYPINYWNGLAGLIAIGLPLMLQMATDARLVITRALAAAALPALLLTLYLTISRGGIGAAAIAIVVFFLFSADRVPKLISGGIAALGGAILILFAHHREALINGIVNDSLRHQGDQVLVATIVVCAVVGLIQAGIALAGRRVERPEWTEVSPEDARIGLAALIVVLLIGFFVAGGPGKISSAVDEFREGESTVAGAGRLSSLAGESRYQIWSSAIREFDTDRLTGTGSGTFEFWWDRDGTVDEQVIDTHSLYLQTLGELGAIGFVLIVGFLGLIVFGGAAIVVRAGPDRRTVLAAALAGCVAFAISAGFDWLWQIPVIAISMLLLGATLIGADPDPRPVAGGATEPDPSGAAAAPRLMLPIPVRIVVALAGLGIVFAIAIPLASGSAIRSSQDAVQRGDLGAALADAETAAAIEPFAATPHLQEALVLEREGAFEAAAAAATKATEAESTNWRTWLVLSRVEARRGNADASLAAYRKAKSLDPRSPIFAS
jgi:hypothetical protein